MKKTGKIQLVFKPTETTNERNVVLSFVGLFQLAKELWKAYKSGCYKFYVFFDANKKERLAGLLTEHIQKRMEATNLNPYELALKILVSEGKDLTELMNNLIQQHKANPEVMTVMFGTKISNLLGEFN